MEDIIFHKITTFSEYPYAVKTLKSSEINKLFPKLINKKKFDDDDVFEIVDRLENDIPELFILENDYVLIKMKYSGTLFPSLKDYKNCIGAIRLGKILEQQSQKETPVYYKKRIDESDPQERIFLTNNGEQRRYYEYSPQKAKTLHDTFPIKESVTIYNNKLKLTAEDGRVAIYSNKPGWPPSYVFMNEEDFDLWQQQLPEPDDSCKIWRGRNPYNEKVLDHKEELLQQLADIVQLKREQITFGIGTHHIVHQALEKLTYTDQTVLSLFLPLTIYLGEQQIKWYGGEWKLLEKPSIDSWIPVIHFQNQDFDLGKRIMWDLLDTQNTDFPNIGTVLWSGKGRKPG